MRLLKDGVLLLELSVLLKVHVRVREVLVALTNRQQNLAALITQLSAFGTQTIIVVDVHFCSLSLLRSRVVDEEVRPILGVGLGLLHPNSAHFAVFAED